MRILHHFYQFLTKVMHGSAVFYRGHGHDGRRGVVATRHFAPDVWKHWITPAMKDRFWRFFKAVRGKKRWFIGWWISGLHWLHCAFIIDYNGYYRAMVHFIDYSVEFFGFRRVVIRIGFSWCFISKKKRLHVKISKWILDLKIRWYYLDLLGG